MNETTEAILSRLDALAEKLGTTMGTLKIEWLLCCLLLAMAATRLIWQQSPGPWACLLFWVVTTTFWALRMSTAPKQFRWPHGLMLLGTAGNAAATLANGGFMPVLGKAEASSLWIPLTNTSRLVRLCDIYAGASLGDMAMSIGVLCLVIICVRAGIERHASKPSAISKLLPSHRIG